MKGDRNYIRERTKNISDNINSMLSGQQAKLDELSKTADEFEKIFRKELEKEKAEEEMERTD